VRIVLRAEAVFRERKARVKSCGKVPLFAVVLAGCVLCSMGRAHAQARAAVAVSSSVDPKATSSGGSKPDSAAREDDNPMGTASIGIKVGLSGTGVASLPSAESASFLGTINARRGMRLAFPIHLGGRGFGWTIEPYLSRSKVQRLVRDDRGGIDGARVFDLTGFGVYTGPSVQLQLARPLYLGLGFGAASSYIESAGFDFGVDLYGRVPLSLTYYVSNQFAFVAEFSAGYGLSLFANKVRTDRSSGRATLVKDPADLGRAFAWDWSFGIRLP
jgi:hypothetical protein